MALKNEIKAIQNIDEPAELLLSHRYLREINFQDNKLKDMQSKEVAGKAVRVIHNGRVGAAPGGLQTPLNRLMETAQKLSEFGRKAAFELPRGDGKLHEAERTDPNVPVIDPDQARGLAETLISRLCKELPDWSVSGGVIMGESINRLVTSRGIEQRFKERGAGFWTCITLPREGDLLELGAGRDTFPDNQTLDSIIEDLVWRAKHAKTVVEMPAGEYPLLLHPEALSSFLEAFNQAVKGRAIFESLSPLKNKIGKKIFDERITLVDDPTDPKLAGYSPFGDEGTISAPVTLIENGVLKSYLTDLDYAARLDQPHTGHGCRFPGSLDEGGPSGEVSISDTSWILSAGNATFNDMMSNISDGIYLLASWDVWSGNLIGGDISGSTHLAYHIKNGKPVGRIKDMRVSGNIYKLLGKKLLEVSKERPETSCSDLRAPYYLIDSVKLA
ncbi:TldD/PmbA family protein [bacterium]|nr:TldD/PmbA family protein [bacterium]